MGGNSFGEAFVITTAGESHGPANVVIVDGVPPGLPLDVTDFEFDMARRRPGQSALVSARKEPDVVKILSGVFRGATTGTALALMIENRDAKSKDYDALEKVYRPGHADFTYDAKFGRRDHRGGGRASARETSARVAAAVVAKKILASENMRVVAYVCQVGSVAYRAPDPTQVTVEAVEASPVRCPDPESARAMIEAIEQARSERDSVGGVAEIVASGVPPGLGEPVFDKLKADLAKALFSLPAVVGVEYGAGFSAAAMRGSVHNDAFIVRPDGITTASNRHGGMLGGISTGLPIVLRAAVKPTSSIPQPQQTVTSDGEPTIVEVKGRHDPCLLPRFVPMAEAMVALVLADHWLRSKR